MAGGSEEEVLEEEKAVVEKEEEEMVAEATVVAVMEEDWVEVGKEVVDLEGGDSAEAKVVGLVVGKSHRKS
jgi:hypothetical protein